VLEHSLQLLLKVARLQRIVVVVHPHGSNAAANCRFFADRASSSTEGGDERCHSGIKRSQRLTALPDATAVGAGARCCTTLLPGSPISSVLLDQLVQHPVGGLLAVPPADTIKARRCGATNYRNCRFGLGCGRRNAAAVPLSPVVGRGSLIASGSH